MAERRREGIDTDKQPEVELEIYDEKEYGQTDVDDRRAWRYRK